MTEFARLKRALKVNKEHRVNIQDCYERSLKNMMSETKVKIKKMRKNARLPAYATSGAAAADLFACVDSEIALLPGQRMLIPTGIAVSLPEGTVAIVCARSGLAYKKGITAAGGVGVIDSDYRGEIFFSAVNISSEEYIIHPGERIAQLMLMPVLAMSFIESEELDDTERGEGGFGSTGS